MLNTVRLTSYKQRSFWALGTVLLLMPVPSINAQSTNATISGVIRDASGGVVPGADLVLTSQQTQTESHFVTGRDGNYRFGNLQAGTYTLTVNAKGFRTFIQQGITVALNDLATLDVTLTVGGSTQTIDVTAAASPINRDDGSHKGEISPDVLKDLPLNVSGSSRSAASFVVVLPGVTSNASAASASAKSGSGASTDKR